jgi:hypothetical protein
MIEFGSWVFAVITLLACSQSRRGKRLTTSFGLFLRNAEGTLKSFNEGK